MGSNPETAEKHWPDFVPGKWRLTRENALDMLRSDGPVTTPPPVYDADLPACHSVYIPVRDGTRLAVDYWLPNQVRDGTRVPAIVVFTRYWRAVEKPVRDPAFDSNAALALAWSRQGFALVVVDPRGSGASFGTRCSEFSADEIRDYADTIDWVAAQSWCTGWLATEGGSYAGNAAEFSCIYQPKALGAVIGRYTDYSAFESVGYPGGIHNLFVISVWSALTNMLDSGDMSGLRVPGGDAQNPVHPKRVDADQSGQQLAAAIREHSQNFNIADAALAIEFADDCPVEGSFSRGEISLSKYKNEIAASGVPLYLWASWMDATTADGALQQFAAMPELPMRVVISAWSHMTINAADPYGKLPVPSLDELIANYAKFLRECIEAPGTFPTREITYYTLGENVWRQTPVWPPDGQSYESLYLQPGQRLGHQSPRSINGFDSYSVDSTASTGRQNRWHTQVGGGAVKYGDRQDEDAKLLCYTSEPLSKDILITGHPVLHLYWSSSTTDAAVFAYLEEVAPDGRVTYLTEGELRAINRRQQENGSVNAMPGPARSFTRSDAMPLLAGQPEAIEFRLLPVSAKIPEGHSLRLALAGADADTFALFPDESSQSWKIFRSQNMASRVDIPVISPSSTAVVEVVF